MGLEAHDIVECSRSIILPQLHHRIGAHTSFGMFQSHRLKRAKQQGVLPAAGHNLYGHATFKEFFLLEILGRRFFCVDQFRPERLIFFLGHGAVDICCLALAITGSPIGLGHIYGFKAYNRRCRIIEVQGIIAGKFGNFLGQFAFRQRAAGHNGNGIVPQGDIFDFFMNHRDIGVAAHLLGDILAETMAVYG